MRTCVFGGGEIGAKDPPEHVFPKWISEKFRPKDAVFLHVPGPYTRAGATVPSPIPEFRSKTFDLTADTICAACNHGWMSDLETQAAPILTPMIEGKPQGLDIERQVLLSAWVAKTALTFDQSMPVERRMLPPEHCRWVKEHQLPPLGGQVRLACYHGTDRHFLRAAYHSLYGELPDDLPALGAPEAHRTTIRIGQLIAEFTVTQDTKPVLTVGGGDLNDMLVTIWPCVAPTSWPPRLLFGDEALESFTFPGQPSNA